MTIHKNNISVTLISRLRLSSIDSKTLVNVDKGEKSFSIYSKSFFSKMKLRPSSDVVLLSCRTKLQLGLTVARLENNSDSDVVPESNQILDILMPRYNSPPNSTWERSLAKIH